MLLIFDSELTHQSLFKITDVLIARSASSSSLSRTDLERNLERIRFQRNGNITDVIELGRINRKKEHVGRCEMRCRRMDFIRAARNGRINPTTTLNSYRTQMGTSGILFYTSPTFIRDKCKTNNNSSSFGPCQSYLPLSRYYKPKAKKIYRVCLLFAKAD